MPDNVVALVPPETAPGMARLNTTWAGQNGDLPDLVAFDLPDERVRQIAREAIEAGDLTDFVVDRFHATPEVPFDRLMVRPKVPFGA